MNTQKYSAVAAATVILFAAFGLSTAQQPVLKIRGRVNPDVYLQSLDIQVEVTGNTASTRHTMVFKNKTNRVLEGKLTFPLPDGRTVTYYALDINGKMRDAVPVDKAKAAEVFEEIEKRQVDPGLLERVAGNNFRTRIYPIPANGTRTVAIGYEEELSLENGQLRYRLPMACQDTLEKFSVKATVWKSNLKPVVSQSVEELRFDRAGENYAAVFARKNYRPARALSFALPAPVDAPQVTMQTERGTRYFFASVAPKMKTRKKRWDKKLAIIWDVSLSGSQRDLKREMETLDIIFSEKKNADVSLYFLNNTLCGISDKNTADGKYRVRNGNWNGLRNVLEKAVFDGGTDFSRINVDALAGNEVLFFSDGISTLSDADFIKNTVVTVKRPIHCVVSSAKADYGAMKLIAGRTSGKFVNLNALSPERLKEELLNETLQFLGTEHGEAVREVYPGIASPVYGNFSLSGISDADDAEATLLFGFGNKVKKRLKIKLSAKNAGEQGNTCKLWGQKKIAELDLNYEKNSAELAELGQRFGVITRNTSLIVLESLDDYIRYDITPPVTETELYTEYMRSQKRREEEQRDKQRNMLEDAVVAVDSIKEWWNTDFTPKQPEPEDSTGGEDVLLGGLMGGGSGGLEIRHHCSLRVSSPDSAIAEEDIVEEEVKNIAPAITVKPPRNDTDYLKKLTGKPAEDYQLYIKLREDYSSSPTFYFDMAEWFYTHNDRELALRVLTSIAELELEDASLYRLLGYRFKEYGEYALEKFVCEKVVQWRPMEPQSYRDHALALADNGEAQGALDSLCGLLTRNFSNDIIKNSRGIEEVVVTEINRLIAKNPNLNTSRIDKRLVTDIHTDIRVVINWNMDNTDIDLHVEDPNGEDCYYGNKLTGIGGRISADNTAGYGPEQFLLKKAAKGKYLIRVNYFGDRQVTSAGPSTVMADIYTKSADRNERRKVACLRIFKAKKKNDKDGDDEYVDVAEFEF